MDALVIVDVQNDFLPGGALAVKEGDRIIPLINRLLSRFDLVVATQDWHPADHGSFAANHPGQTPGNVIDLFGLNQILWPVHCVQGTEGAAFHSDLETKNWRHVFRKGTDSRVDSYSGFFDNGRRADTGLGEYLKNQGATSVYICGLATDYCVKYTALDAFSLGFETILIQDACRAVNLKPTDEAQAIHEMKESGVRVVNSQDFFGR